MGRLPDFLIIGAMKAGTTSLFAWLGEHSGVFVPGVKEPAFFGEDRRWAQGLDWYQELFALAGDGQLAGEASVSYTDPGRSAEAAERMARVVPGIKLLFLARHPIERARSHYRHEVLRGRERSSFDEAIRDSDSMYLARSMYFRALEPYVERFAGDQLRVVRFEDLFVSGDEEAWIDVLAFLGLSPRPRPSTRLNASAEREQFGRAMTLMWRMGIRRPPGRVPALARRFLKPLLIRREASPLLATADQRIPDAIAQPVWEDVGRLESWLGRGSAMWDRNVGVEARPRTDVR